jgi:methylisocitrate lyase
MTIQSAGAKFRQAVKEETPLAVVGCVNAYFARLATQSGFKAIYLSGGGVAACSRGIPDLGITSLEDVLIDAQRITDNVDTPLLVDIDTGWGGAFNIARTIKAMEKAGVAAVHLEDQVAQKRCGHRPNKAIVSLEEMVDRVKAAVDARVNPDFVIMARTDALAVEGLQSAIERAQACVEAGADMIFPEAITELGMYRQFADAVNVPILANITEFGATPLYSQQELGEAGVSLVPSRKNPWPVGHRRRQHRLCTVGTGNDLHYRGYDILDFANIANSRKSPTCWCTASCPTRPSWPPTRPS